MRSVARLSLMVTCCTVAFATACSDSTSPNASLDPSQLAAHFDSLYVAALALGTDAGSDHAGDLGFLEIAPALGAKPVDVAITTGRSTEYWRGFMLVAVFFRDGVPSDSTYLLTAYRELDAQTILTAEFDSNGRFEFGTVIAGNARDIVASGGSGTVARTSLGGACATPSSLLTDPYLAFWGSLPCTQAAFSASVAMTFPARPDLDPPYQTVSVSSTAFNGVRLADTPAMPGIVGRMRVMRKASRSRSGFQTGVSAVSETAP